MVNKQAGSEIYCIRTQGLKSKSWNFLVFHNFISFGAWPKRRSSSVEIPTYPMHLFMKLHILLTLLDFINAANGTVPVLIVRRRSPTRESIANFV